MNGRGYWGAMWPTLIEVEGALGTMPVNTYGLFIMLAFSAAFLLIHTRARRVGVNPDRLIPGYLAAAAGGLLGARLLYAISVDWDQTLANPLSLLSCSGFAVYGGVLGGIVAVLGWAHLNRLPLWPLADLAAPAVVLANGVGRIGCFFAGCCHGAIAPTPHDPVGLLPEAFTGGQIWLSNTFPFVTTEFHQGVGRIHDVPLYPTQMFEATAYLALGALLAWAWTRRRFDGQIAALTLIVQPPVRIVSESLRADERGYFLSWEVSDSVAAWFPGMSQAGDQLGAHIVGITTSQGIGLLMMIAGVTFLALRRGADLTAAPPVASEGDLLEELA
jgi:phosphatidylglycerol---prolipoprotein diacylglyceryl transferase